MVLSCNKFDVEEAVDQNYLDTPSYQSFKEISRSRKEQSLKGKEQLEAFVKRAIKQEVSDPKSIPFSIDEEYISRIITQEENETGSTFIISRGMQRFFYLATAGDTSLGYHFFLLCKVSAYKNCAIGLATTDRGKTVDLRLLAPFKRMLTYDEISTLKINQREIDIEIRSQVRYPIKQENVYGKRYVISTEGAISEAENK